MTSTTQSSQFDTLTPIQVQVLQSLVAGQSFTAAKEAGVHRTSVHLWTRTLPTSPVKLVAQRPTTLSTAFSDSAFEKLDTGLRIAEIINPPKTARPAPAPAAVRSSPSAAAARSAKPEPPEKIKYRETNPAILFKTLILSARVPRVPEGG